jgi:hypothetical protein
VGAVCREPVSLLFAKYQGDFRKKQRTGGQKCQKGLRHRHFSNIASIRYQGGTGSAQLPQQRVSISELGSGNMKITGRAGWSGRRAFGLLTEDVGDPMLAQHLHSLMMFRRLAIANGYGWQRFLHMVDQVLPRRGDTLQLPFNDPNLDKEATTNGREAQNEDQDIREER